MRRLQNRKFPRLSTTFQEQFHRTAERPRTPPETRRTDSVHISSRPTPATPGSARPLFSRRTAASRAAALASSSDRLVSLFQPSHSHSPAIRHRAGHTAGSSPSRRPTGSKVQTSTSLSKYRS